MKAMVYEAYGPPEVLQISEIEKPVPKEDQVLVQVHAASVNYPDWAFVRGEPFMVRLTGAGLLKPKHTIPGADIAGRVEAVGGQMSRFRPGDEVFGDISACGFGGFAEYVSVPESALALKPADLSFAGAAALPMAAVVALQALRDRGRVQPGQQVLIVGASGGNGTFAVQIAKSLGAHVTGVCSTKNVDMVRSIGADEVIDYTAEDFARNGGRYDLVLATAGYRSIFDYRRVLRPEGIYVSVGGAMGQTFQALLLGPWLSMTGTQKMGAMLAMPSQKDLIRVKELVEAGQVAPVIDRSYPLAEAAQAIRYYGQGRARGKVVVMVNADS